MLERLLRELAFPGCGCLARASKVATLAPKRGLVGPSLSAPQWGSNMVHPSQTGLRQPSDHRPGNWRDVVGLLIALIGFALVIGVITLTI